jgi:penicillin amidase
MKQGILCLDQQLARQKMRGSWLALLFSLIAISAQGIEIPQQTISVAGLSLPADILIDHWGVPHIYAQTDNDVFFLQGYNIAKDRLFQIDLWRRRGLGKLAEVFGPSYIERDKAARLFLYRGNMQTEWQRYDSKAQAITQHFVAGINAYIDWLEKHPDQLPYEFKKLRYWPAKWQPEDVVRIRSHALTMNVTSAVERANIACKADLNADKIRLGLQPVWQTKIPAGLDPCLPKGVLDLYELATGNVQVSKGSAEYLTTDRKGVGRGNSEGSNSWVISPLKSTSGRPIMASDPHRAYTLPSLRYIVHLHSPHLNIIGAGEPVLPGIAIGHNGTVAFGLTFFSMDQEDLYVYQLNPKNLHEYNYQGHFEPFKIIQETIHVRNGQPLKVKHLFTRHGPVLYLDQDKQQAYALRSVWLEPGTSPYFGSVSYLHAKSFQQFQQAMRHWGTPPSNLLYADIRGNIGWIVGGLAPIRPNWDGLFPVPGDGRYEWKGFWNSNQLPSVYNPKIGYFSSSNEENFPIYYPYQTRKLAFEWLDGSRHERIEEVLKSLPKISLADSMRLQNDFESIPARRLLKLLAPLHSTDANAQAALLLLKGWDARLNAASAQAALYEVWFSIYLGDMFKNAILAQRSETFGPTDPRVMLHILEDPQSYDKKFTDQKRDQLLVTSLSKAYTKMRQLQGADSKKWCWGKLLVTWIKHPFTEIFDSATQKKLNIGPLPRGGSAFTVNLSEYDDNNFRQITGASFRVIVDVGNWDNSWAINFPGQSGDPNSAHYRDLVLLWQNGQYFPLLYTRAAIEAAAETWLHFLPM